MTTAQEQIKFAITAEDRFSRVFGALKRDLTDAKGAAAGLVGSIARIAGPLGSIAGAVGLGGGALIFRRLADDLAALQDAADGTGATVERLSALEEVALRNGDTLGTVSEAVAKLNKSLADAKPGSAIEATLKSIGLSAEQLRTLDPADAVATVARALSQYADDGNRARIEQVLFGESSRKLAGFLRDVAEANELTSNTTAEAVEQADRFNKQMAQLQTNVTLVARGITAELLPAVNRFLSDLRGGGIGKALGLDGIQSGVTQLGDIYKLVGLARERFSQLAVLKFDPTNPQALEELARIDREAASLGANLKAAREAYLGLNSQAGAGRGFVNPALVKPSAPDVAGIASKGSPSRPAAEKVSEAQRYAESLQRQAERLEELTTLQQLELDIRKRRIDGLTPALEAELRGLAQQIDLQKQLNAEKEREAGFQRLLTEKDQRDLDQVQSLLSQTRTGRLQRLEGDADRLLNFSRRIGADDPRQRQVIEAMEELKRQSADIANPVSQAEDQFKSLADTIEKTMDRSTDAILDFVTTGKTDVNGLLQSFSRDILRDLIEDPIRDTMKQVTKSIREAAASGQLDIGKLLSTIFGKGGNGGIDFSAILSSVGGFFGFTGRASGGGVNAGELVRWQENGREWFVPGADGTVVTQAQMRAASGAGSVQQVNHFNIQGGDPAEVERRISRALERNNAALMRSRRLQGAMSGF